MRPSFGQNLADIGNGWTHYGGDSGGHRYSAADEVTLDNVRSLKIAWQYRTGAFDEGTPKKSVVTSQATPILANGKLYICTPLNVVIALDPGTGQEIWRFDPQVDRDFHAGTNMTCRGVSYWQNAAQDGGDAVCQMRIVAGTNDARVVVLDAELGTPCSDFGDNGQIHMQPDKELLWDGEYQITSAPAIVGDTIVVGSAIADNRRVDAPSGMVQAFDIRSGEQKWTFDPIPRNPDDPAYSTWGLGTKNVGHANVWSTISVDETRNLVFLPTSSASPDYFGGHRPGDNRYSNSVVALEGTTGKVRWHFQTIHHDIWDLDVPSQPGLYQVFRDGKIFDVVAVPTKTGMVFVLDRDTGEPFLEVEERPVPQAGVPGEVLSPTQPFTAKTPVLVPNAISPQDAWGITFWDKRNCRKQIEVLRNEGPFTPPSLEGTLTHPFAGGGANWGSSAYDPGRNLLVVNMTNIASSVKLIPREQIAPEDSQGHSGRYRLMTGSPYVLERSRLFAPTGTPCNPPPLGHSCCRRPFQRTDCLA